MAQKQSHQRQLLAIKQIVIMSTAAKNPKHNNSAKLSSFSMKFQLVELVFFF